MMLRTMLVLAAATTLPISADAQQRQRSPELDRLSSLIGHFEGEVRIEQPEREPIVGRMRYTAQWELDSAWVVARYEQTLMGRTTSGLLMYSWDAALREYLFYGFANNPMQPHRLRGSFEGNVLVFKSDSVTGVRYRESWHPVGRDTLVTTLMAMQGTLWVTGPRTVLVRRDR